MNQHSNKQMNSSDQKIAPKTARGKLTREKIINAAASEFGTKGFHETSISDITKTAGVALGTFYVYFESKESIFRAILSHMGELTRHWISKKIAGAPDRLSAERMGIEAFIEFVREHKDLYRIVMEAQFVANDAYINYYSVFADAYIHNLDDAVAKGEISAGQNEERAWALIGMSVFLGLKYGVWDEHRDPKEVANAVGSLLESGLGLKK